MSGSFWDDEAGYDLRDPKHPDHYDVFSEYADMWRKRRKEDELVGGGPCAVCGRDPAVGFAKIGNQWYCHGDFQPDPTCYMRGQRELVFACEDPESAWIQQLRDELGGEAA